MDWIRALPPLRWLRVVYVLCIVALSVQTMGEAHGLGDHHFWLAGCEIIGNCLLLVWQTQIAGLSVLLAVYLIAAIVTLHRGHLPTSLVLYAATALCVVQGDRPAGAAAYQTEAPRVSS
jgi:hypothetical protein